MKHLSVSFAVIDPLNPQFGYSLKIEDEFGHTLLFTSRAPDTGKDLLSPADCMRVVAMYIAPESDAA